MPVIAPSALRAEESQPQLEMVWELSSRSICFDWALGIGWYVIAMGYPSTGHLDHDVLGELSPCEGDAQMCEDGEIEAVESIQEYQRLGRNLWNRHINRDECEAAGDPESEGPIIAHKQAP